MKARPLSISAKVVALSSVVLVTCALWLSREGVAAAEGAVIVPTQNDESVQDKDQQIDIDTKIFLHRNGLVASTGRLQGRG